MPFSKKEEIIKRRSLVAEMYLKGYFQADIAKKLGVTQQQVSQDLKVIYKNWKNSAVRNFDELKDRELVKIDNLETTYWQAWEGSKKEGSSVGDARFLQGIQWCVAKRCEILGVNSPQEIKNVTTITDQDRKEIIDELVEAQKKAKQ